MQSERVWFLYSAIAMAKGSEVGRRAKPLEEYGPSAQLGATQSGGSRAGSGREIREGSECF